MEEDLIRVNAVTWWICFGVMLFLQFGLLVVFYVFGSMLTRDDDIVIK